MSFTKILAPVAIILLTVGAWRQFGWAGIALAGGGYLMSSKGCFMGCLSGLNTGAPEVLIQSSPRTTCIASSIRSTG